MKQLLTACLLLLCSNHIWAKTSLTNATCETAIETQQTTTQSVTKVELNSTDNQAWYWFIAKTSKVQIKSNTSYTRLIEDCNIVKYFYNFHSNSSSDSLAYTFNSIDLTIGKKYYININDNKNTLFSVSELITPSNDNCANASLIVQNDSLVITKQDISVIGTSYLWFRFKATSSDLKVFANCYQLNLYSACNGDKIKPNISKYPYNYSPGNATATLNRYTNLTIGTEYLIQLYPTAEARVAVSKFTRSQNDDCTNPKLIEQTATPVFYKDSLTNATATVDGDYADLWYTFQAKTNTIQIKTAIANLYESCGGGIIKPVYMNTNTGKIYYYTNLTVGQNYLLAVSSYNDYSQFAVYDKTLQPNDDCSGAENIVPADTFMSHYADLSLAIPSNVEIPDLGWGSSNNQPHPDLWYKFIATSRSMSVIAYPSTPSTYYAHAICLAIYDNCNGNLLGTSIVNKGGFTPAEVRLHNLVVGKEYLYRIADMGYFLVLIRTAEPILKPNLITHGVMSLPATLNDSINKPFVICYDETTYNNSMQYKTGRKPINGSNCSTSITDNRTIEAFYKICTTYGVGFHTGEIEIKSDNKKLMAKLEILSDLGNNNYKQISCSNFTLNSRSSYTTSDQYYKNIQNTILRIEISDTSSTGISNYDFGFVINQTLASIEDNVQTNTTNIYPNPSTEQITIDLENSSATKAEIFNQYGEIVFTRNLTEKTTTINYGLTPGMYIIKLTSANNTTSSKLFVK